MAQSAQEGATTNSLKTGEDSTRHSISRPELIKLPELVDNESLNELDVFLENVMREGNAVIRRHVASQILDEV